MSATMSAMPLQLLLDVLTAEALDLRVAHLCRQVVRILASLRDLSRRPVPVADADGQRRGVAEHVRPAMDPEQLDHLHALARDAVRELWILTGRGEAQVDAGPQLGIDEPVRVACRDRSDERDDALTDPPDPCQGGSSGHQELDRLARQVEALGRRQDVVDDRDGVGVPADQQIAPGELSDQLDVLGRLAQVAVLIPGRLQQRGANRRCGQWR